MKEAALARIAKSPVEAGQAWRHSRTGVRYLVIAMAVDEASLTPVVVYRGPDGVFWTRALDVFLSKKDGHWRFVYDYDTSVMDRAQAFIEGK